MALPFGAATGALLAKRHCLAMTRGRTEMAVLFNINSKYTDKFAIRQTFDGKHGLRRSIYLRIYIVTTLLTNERAVADSLLEVRTAGIDKCYPTTPRSSSVPECLLFCWGDRPASHASLSVNLCARHNQRQGGVLCRAEPRSWTAP